MRSLICLILAIACGIELNAAAESSTPTPEEQFNAATRLYEQGRYAEAVAAYETLLQRGRTSAAVHFNLGNAYFRSGQLGKAIAQYRIAQSLSPRDPDILANLRFARQQVAGTESVAVSPWLRRLNRLRLNEWTLLASGAFWLTCGLLVVGQARPTARRRLRPLLVTGAVATALLVTATFGVWAHQRHSPLAVILRPETSLRYGPLEESQVHFTVQEGTELTVEDVQEDWVQLTDAAQRTGWVRRSALWLPGTPGSH